MDKARNILKIADLGLGRAFSVPVKSYTHEARLARAGTSPGRADACDRRLSLSGTERRRCCWAAPTTRPPWTCGPPAASLVRQPAARPSAPVLTRRLQRSSLARHPSSPATPSCSSCSTYSSALRFRSYPRRPVLTQVGRACRLLGTPSDEVWPGVSRLRDWHEFPQWKPQDLARVIPELDAAGIDLMSKMLQYDPAKRIHATEALRHPYFDSLEKTQFDRMQEMNEEI